MPTGSTGARVAATVRSKNPLKGAVEVLPQRLYYAALKAPPPSHNILASTPRRKNPAADNSSKDQTPVEKKQIHFFNMDNELVYWNFFLDFGPLNLGQLTRFSNRLNEKLRKFPVVCFYSSTVPAKRANAIFLICAWQLIYLARSPEQAYRGFVTNSKSAAVAKMDGKKGTLPPVSQSQGSVTVAPLPPFHDASPCACTYDLTVVDCLRGMAKAMSLGWFDPESFDVDEYEHFEQVENGDLNWLVKDRIIAFAGPSYERHISPEGYCTLSPSDYIPYFLQKNVSLVVRLNKKAYHEEDFVEAGINHVEAFFLDGSCPPMKILHGVIEAFESVPEDEAFAVHCKAGLGRTGTCIGAYLMKHYRFTAAEIVAWMRICRPGCVIGPQQHFLEKIEPIMWQEGEAAGLIERPLALNHDDVDDENDQGAPMATEQQRSHPVDAVAGRAGQAEGLLAARGRRPGHAPTTQTPTRNSKNSKATPVTPEQGGSNAVPVTPDSNQAPQLWCG